MRGPDFQILHNASTTLPQNTQLMKTTALLFLLPFTLAAQDAFEQPPTFSAAAILKPEYAAGAGFTVRDVVPTYGFASLRYSSQSAPTPAAFTSPGWMIVR